MTFFVGIARISTIQVTVLHQALFSGRKYGIYSFAQGRTSKRIPMPLHPAIQYCYHM